jgi:pilus assembly protein CpaB
MNWKTWFPLILAIVLGVVAAKAAHDWVVKNKAAAAPAGKFTKVVVAKADTPPGKGLTADDLVVADIETASAPTNAFPTTDKVIGRVNESFMVKGQPVVEAMLAPVGAGSGLQALVPEGMRAITVEVNEFSGVAGLLTPGCKVDIVATLSAGDANGQVTRTVVQDVKVTAVGQRTSVAGDAPPPPNEIVRSVTVLVKPDQAVAIELACATSRPRLLLRGGRDNEIVASAGISVAELRSNGRKDDTATASAIGAVPTTRPAIASATTQPSDAFARVDVPHRTVKVIRGGQESTVTMEVLDGNPPNTVTDTKDPFDSESK